ncbi:non-canonical purine NTP pyrophosphatase [Oceanirhabdus sp. W0125-5]|uniref:non-canonical purine NTP pyrophosphatase n=1 Tax=Oceanirhabdus sp. W0125-5 TaxID=2999116 RepID=UPI0022F2C1D1|nr:non-canonical purine NTP pyrophosphatase [Oceanirhabdus sp. W0125-5]WBW99577.1 non-canonical purine NTP pyrophosphatase [Oceanirhabdus sp. W0125-5]
MELVYGTTNPGKLTAMKRMLASLDMDILSLRDFDIDIPEVDESGNAPLENAKLKALAYYKVLKKPVFSCDSGLFIKGLEEAKQPGVHVRRVNGKNLTDEEMIEYYASLAHEMGGQAIATYKNGICLVLDENTIIEYDGDDISSEEFIITSTPHQNRVHGFPLNSLSIEIKSGKFYMDLDRDDGTKNAYDEGFLNFFKRSLKTNV